MSDHTVSTDQVNADVLVVYASTHGHTAKIAARLAEAVRGQGVVVDLHEVEQAAAAEPGHYDLVVVAGSLHKQHHQKAIVSWVTGRRDALAGVASVFVSVSLSAADDSAEPPGGAAGLHRRVLCADRVDARAYRADCGRAAVPRV